MFETEAKEYAQNLEKELMKEYEEHPEYGQCPALATIPTPHAEKAYQVAAETTLRKVIKYLASRVIDNNCGGYFSFINESEERLQEFAKEI